MKFLLNLLEVSFEHLMYVSFQGTVIALLVLAIGWMTGNRIAARWRFILWLVVLGRFALLVAPSTSWSLFNVLDPFAPDTTLVHVSESAVPVDVMARSSSPPLSPLTVGLSQPGATLQSLGDPVQAFPSPDGMDWSAITAPKESSNRTFGIMSVLSVAWLIGAVWLLIRKAHLHFSLMRQRFLWSVPRDAQVMEMLEQCRRQCQVMVAVKLRLSSGVGPATLGILRPTIVIPAVMMDELSRDELRYVLLHELLHIRRRDWLTELIASILGAVHWMNPMIWIVTHLLRLEREFACDAAVLGLLEEPQRIPYGRAVLKVMGLSSQQQPATTVVGMTTYSTSLHRRIEMISSYRKTSRVSVCSGVMLLLFLVAFGWTNAGAQEGAQQQQSNTETESIVVNNLSVDSSVEDQASVASDLRSLNGICRDVEGLPLSGVRVRVFRESEGTLGTYFVDEQTTTDDGTFKFTDLPRGTKQDWLRHNVVATIPGFATSKQSGRTDYGDLEEWQDTTIELEMRAAKTLQGRVTDTNGNPVEDADVWLGYSKGGPISNATSTKTDSDGAFVINDLREWDYNGGNPRDLGNGVTSIQGKPRFNVRHPNFAHIRKAYVAIPSVVDVVVKDAGMIEGRIIDGVTGEPAAGIRVSMQSIDAVTPNIDDEVSSWQEVMTDELGRYRLTSLAAYQYNIWANVPDRTSEAIDSIVVKEGETTQARDIRLIEGSWIEGQIVDADTGEPVSQNADGHHLKIGLYGPARPESGAAVEVCDVDDEGRFRIRVVPARNFPYIMVGGVSVKKTEVGQSVDRGDVREIHWRDHRGRSYDVAPDKTTYVMYHVSIPVESEVSETEN